MAVSSNQSAHRSNHQGSRQHRNTLATRYRILKSCTTLVTEVKGIALEMRNQRSQRYNRAVSSTPVRLLWPGLKSLQESVRKGAQQFIICTNHTRMQPCSTPTESLYRNTSPPPKPVSGVEIFTSVSSQRSSTIHHLHKPHQDATLLNPNRIPLPKYFTTSKTSIRG